MLSYQENYLTERRLRVVVRLWSLEWNCEISHAARAFSLLLAGGALARVMKLTAEGRGAFTGQGENPVYYA